MAINIGRGPYSCLLACLDPNWKYSAASIAEFALAFGFLDLLIPDPMPTPKKHNKIRLAFEQNRYAQGFPCEKGGPANADTLTWFGWRWQKFENSQKAHYAIFLHLQPIFDNMQQNRKYNINDLLEIWDSLPPQDFASNPCRKTIGRENWRQFNKMQTRIMLWRHGQRRGLDLVNSANSQGYYLKEWCKTPYMVSEKDLQNIRCVLKPGSSYTPASILALHSHLGNLKKSDVNHYRAALFKLAQKQTSPENGDTSNCHEGWLGSRWLRAIGALQIS